MIELTNGITSEFISGVEYFKRTIDKSSNFGLFLFLIDTTIGKIYSRKQQIIAFNSSNNIELSEYYADVASRSDIYKRSYGEFTNKHNTSYENSQTWINYNLLLDELCKIRFSVHYRIKKPVQSLLNIYTGRPGDDDLYDLLHSIEDYYQDWLDGKIEL